MSFARRGRGSRTAANVSAVMPPSVLAARPAAGGRLRAPRAGDLADILLDVALGLDRLAELAEAKAKAGMYRLQAITDKALGRDALPQAAALLADRWAELVVQLERLTQQP
jgi:hypothetical protein